MMGGLQVERTKSQGDTEMQKGMKSDGGERGGKSTDTDCVKQHWDCIEETKIYIELKHRQ